VVFVAIDKIFSTSALFEKEKGVLLLTHETWNLIA
jgi:hypothetical protein